MRAVAILFSLTLVSCQSPDVEESAAGRRPIVGGGYDATDPAVVYLAMQIDATGNNAQMCSGVILDHRPGRTVVALAAHCIRESNYVAFLCRTPSPTSACPASQREWISQRDCRAPFITTDCQAVHPSYVPGCRASTCGDDIGVLVFNRDLGLPALRVVSDPPPATVGAPIRLVGFGVDSPTGRTGVKHAAISSIGPATNADFVIPATGSPQGCSGDSGSPVIEPPTSTIVVGIMSQQNGCVIANGGSWYVRVDRHIDWLAGFVPVCPTAGCGSGGTASLNVSPGGVTIGPGLPATVILSTDSTVDLSVAVNGSWPSGVTASFTPSNVVRSGAPIRLDLSAVDTVPAANVTVSLAAVSATVQATAMLSVGVDPSCLCNCIAGGQPVADNFCYAGPTGQPCTGQDANGDGVSGTLACVCRQAGGTCSQGYHCCSGSCDGTGHCVDVAGACATGNPVLLRSLTIDVAGAPPRVWSGVNLVVGDGSCDLTLSSAELD
jgi:hypothetical protein